MFLVKGKGKLWYMSDNWWDMKLEGIFGIGLFRVEVVRGLEEMNFILSFIISRV